MVLIVLITVVLLLIGSYCGARGPVEAELSDSRVAGASSESCSETRFEGHFPQWPELSRRSGLFLCEQALCEYHRQDNSETLSDG